MADMMETNSASTDQRPRQARSNSRHHRRSEHNRLTVVGLTIALVLCVLALIGTAVYTGLRIHLLSETNSALQQQIFFKEQELDKLKPQLQQTEQELAELIEGRLPKIRKLTPDQVLAINQDSIKNIVFTVVGQGNKKQYEYKIVIENRSADRISPKYMVSVFDKRGIQIGMDQISVERELAPGETRSFSDMVKLFMKEEPAYFEVSTSYIEALDH